MGLGIGLVMNMIHMTIKEGFYKCRNGMKAEVIRILDKPELDDQACIGFAIHNCGMQEMMGWTKYGKFWSDDESEWDLIEPWIDKIKIEREVTSEELINGISFYNDYMTPGKRFKCTLEEIN